MNDCIIYQTNDGAIAVVIPAPECGLSVQEIAAKDVPDGRTFRIIQAAELPPREFRTRWRWTDSGPLSVEDETP